MDSKNTVFIATSLDGYIADKNGGIEWLNSIPNPEQDDMGYSKFMSGIDALVMGRKTFETVIGFDIPWPYDKPVFVLSNSLEEIPKEYKQKAFIVRGKLTDILSQIHQKDYQHLYIDGGTTIRSFLAADLIDEMVLTTMPVLLGGGSPLFGQLPNELEFELVSTKTYLNQISQCHYKRKKRVPS